MLLVTAICFSFVIKMCSSASSPEHFDEVFACVEKDSKENATTVTWTIALYLQMNNKNVYCDLVYRQNQSLSSASLMYQAPSGNLNLPGLQMAAQYIIQMICFAKAPNGSRSTHKSSEVSFIAGPSISKVCSQSSPPYYPSNGQMLLCNQATLGDNNNSVQWWSFRPSLPQMSCVLFYTSNAMTTQHRTETFREGNLPMSGSLLFKGDILDLVVECSDGNNNIQSAGIVRKTEDSMQRRCSSSSAAVVDRTLPVTSKMLPTEPTRYKGLHVSSVGQGLVLAFSIVFVSFAMSVLAYKRYKSYLRRRSQRLLRIETDEEVAAMHDFQRMV
ncbi:uncharacterized protein LOC117297519 [Asterias rubens]|uniref:uncharacterized protein LOC117297519 n=1 Tax=Asterias rubens TaxID=7604 RepID=UPI0014557F8A|nr:uncharacterized protein LOC117297519 [Asterias rubens]